MNTITTPIDDLHADSIALLAHLRDRHLSGVVEFTSANRSALLAAIDIAGRGYAEMTRVHLIDDTGPERVYLMRVARIGGAK